MRCKFCANDLLKTCSQERLKREEAYRIAQGKKSSKNVISGTNQETDPEGILEYMLCLTFLTVTVPAGVSQWLVTPEVKGGKIPGILASCE